LRIQVLLIDSELSLQFNHFIFTLFELVKASVKMTLLLNQFSLLLAFQGNEMPNEIKEISRSDVIELLSRPHQLLVQISNSYVHLNDDVSQNAVLRVYDLLAVYWIALVN
jgi:hypothetical protein